MWFIYILLCKDGSLYTGSYKKKKKRLLAHQNGTGAKYTRSHKPLQIIHSERFETKSAALKRELEIKGWSRQKKIAELKLVM